MTAMVDIRLFGQANVSSAGAPVKLSKRSTTIALLAYIILKRGAPVSRQSIAFALFSDLAEETALAELRRYLHLASKSLLSAAGEPLFIVDAETVRWNDATSARVDVLDFERLAGNADTHAQAVDVYCGDLLEDSYDDWVFPERERLRSLYLTLLYELADRSRGSRQFAAAISYAKRLLETDPWREDVLRTLVGARYESGDTAGALADYASFAKRLRDELATTPMPETVALRQAIVNGDAVPGSLRGMRFVSEGSRVPVVTLPFVGRGAELAVLHRHWTQAARGKGTMVVLSGEAGVGKTRLVSEFGRLVQAEGGRMLAGSTSAPESMPFQALVEALKSGMALLLAKPPPPGKRSVLARFLPDLRDADFTEIELAPRSTERETARTYDAFVHAVKTLASPRPLLLVLEDLHWAQTASMEALEALIPGLSRTPVLVLVTFREEDVSAGHALRSVQHALRASHQVYEIHLDRLDRKSVEDLVHGITELRDRQEQLAPELYAHSEGNALFLSEAISDALQGIEPSAGRATVRTIIATRIERLAAEGRTVAEIAAVAGAGCSVSLVRSVSNMPAAEVARGFDELLDRGVLREAGARSEHDYVFGHHLIMQAVYDLIEPHFRAQRHSRVARYLEDGYRDHGTTSPREIATHYECAGDLERSASWYLKAAQRAAIVHAYADAEDLATRALQNAASGQARRSSLEVREKARGRRGDRQGQLHDIDELDRLARGDAAGMFDVLSKRVALARSAGETDQESRLIAQMLRASEDLGERAIADALKEAATHAGLCSRSGEGLEPARRALEIYERSNDVRGQLECLYLLVDFTTNLGDIDASRRYLDAMRDRSASLADKEVEARALSVAAVAALLRQEYRESFSLSERALRIAIQIADREGEAASRGRLAVTAAWLADYDTALREFDAAIETYESIGHKRGLAVTETNRALPLMRVGLFNEALEAVERSNAYFHVVQEKRTIVANNVNASFITLQLGDAVKAKSFASAALADARDVGFPVFEAAALANLGNAERTLRQFSEAIAHLESGLSIRRPIQEARDFVDDLADLTLCYVGAGRYGDARATARELFAVGHDSLENAFWPHYAWWSAAQGLDAGGDLSDAVEARLRARDELRRFADRIPRRLRAGFLSIPINALIAQG